MLNSSDKKNKTSFIKRLVGLSCRSSETLSASNSVTLGNEMGLKCCLQITFMFIILKNEMQQQEKPVRIRVLFQSARAAPDGTWKAVV